VLEGPSGRSEYLASYRRADIALDPFPYTGGATTIESLWMGVPVLTLAGERLVSRQGVSLLANIGLEDWIATDVNDYVNAAATHAHNLGALAALRAGLRMRVLNSPLFDGPRFARHLSDAFFSMWSTYAKSVALSRSAKI
jgi:predicted O-linked N-acetylglucosamine transferase (SPINDLY family)